MSGVKESTPDVIGDVGAAVLAIAAAPVVTVGLVSVYAAKGANLAYNAIREELRSREIAIRQSSSQGRITALKKLAQNQLTQEAFMVQLNYLERKIAETHDLSTLNNYKSELSILEKQIFADRATAIEQIYNTFKEVEQTLRRMPENVLQSLDYKKWAATDEKLKRLRKIAAQGEVENFESTFRTDQEALWNYCNEMTEALKVQQNRIQTGFDTLQKSLNQNRHQLEAASRACHQIDVLREESVGHLNVQNYELAIETLNNAQELYEKAFKTIAPARVVKPDELGARVAECLNEMKLPARVTLKEGGLRIDAENRSGGVLKLYYFDGKMVQDFSQFIFSKDDHIHAQKATQLLAELERRYRIKTGRTLGAVSDASNATCDALKKKADNWRRKDRTNTSQQSMQE